jgi:hypothetical protein
MFKILLIPENVLLKSFIKQGENLVNTSFRKLAIMIHPDKNSHPLAQNGF